MRVMYTAVSSAAARPRTYTRYSSTLPGMPSQLASARLDSCARSNTAPSTMSLEKKPENGGMPDSARPPITMQPNVNGMTLRKPPMRSRSWTPPMAEITEPAAMNSSALKKAWVMRWNRPAV